MNSNDLWLAGKIGKPVGLRGECVIHPISANPDDLERVASAPVRLAPKGSDPLDQPERDWTGLRWHNERAIAQFEGLETREEIAKFTHWEIWVDGSAMPEPEEPDTWWINDLVGCEAFQVGEEGQPDVSLGEVVAIAEAPSHDLLIIADVGGKRSHVPFIKAFLVEVNVEDRIIRLDLPDGLIES